jgi:aspartyl protease family protein
MTRALLLGVAACAALIGALLWTDPVRLILARDTLTQFVESVMTPPANAVPASAVEVPRGRDGFKLTANINGTPATMVVDTGATTVVLTYETARAIGLPLELLDYDVDVETAGGKIQAARLTLSHLKIGRLSENDVPALVAQSGQMKTNLLGMSFLSRLESVEVRANSLKLRGY